MYIQILLLTEYVSNSVGVSNLVKYFALLCWAGKSVKLHQAFAFISGWRWGGLEFVICNCMYVQVMLFVDQVTG